MRALGGSSTDSLQEGFFRVMIPSFDLSLFLCVYVYSHHAIHMLPEDDYNHHRQDHDSAAQIIQDNMMGWLNLESEVDFHGRNEGNEENLTELDG